MDWEDELSEDDEQQKNRQKKQQKSEDSEEDEGTLEYAQRPKSISVDAQVSVFDRGSLNRQQGINTQPSVFDSTWK